MEERESGRERERWYRGRKRVKVEKEIEER